MTAQPKDFALWPPDVIKQAPSFSDLIFIWKPTVRPLVHLARSLRQLFPLGAILRKCPARRNFATAPKLYRFRVAPPDRVIENFAVLRILPVNRDKSTAAPSMAPTPADPGKHV